MASEKENEGIEEHLEILQEDIRKIEKQFILKKDLDQLKRNVHKLVDKSTKLNLKNSMSKPKLFETIKKNSEQTKRNKELFIEHQGDNKFKVKSIKNKNKVIKQIEAE
tara:strand:+ start:3206 stop:3529 length:324 start_codon:yes stop_codon:yes gene_type:complete